MSKSGQKIARSVKCPLYHKHEKLRLFCDPVLYGGLSTITPFETIEERVEFMARFCKDPKGWRQCPLAKMTGGLDDDYQ